MQRKARDLLLFPVDNNIFTVKRQVGVFAGDKQGVEQLSHGGRFFAGAADRAL